MPQRAVRAIGPQAPKPRIVQHKNRRYSIRLEPVFWQSLERLAEGRRLRLGQFVAELANQYRGNNFASHLRVVCMLEGERSLAQASLQPTAENLLDVVMACASPGLLLSRYRTIIAHNDSFLAWLGLPDRQFAGADLTSVIQVRTRRPLNDLWLDMIAGNLANADANVLFVEPGRVVAAAAKMLALHAPQSDDFYAIMWLSANKRSASPTQPTPSGR